MNYPEIIHHYLEGNATHEQEEQLFAGMADRPEWRDELQLQLRIQEAAQRDLPSLTVPPSARTAIFSRLGFNQSSGVMQGGWSAIQSGFRLLGLSLPVAASVGAGVGLLLVGAGAYLAYTNLAVKPESQVIAHDVIAHDEALSFPPSVAPTSRTATSPATDIPSPNQVRSANKAAWAIEKTRPFAHANPPEASVHAWGEHDLTTRQAWALAEPRKPAIPNEPLTSYVDAGKFSSQSYLTPEKILGVADGGKIFCSENGGKTWMLQTSGTQNDLNGIHFLDMFSGVAVGANGIILLTSDAGHEWRTIPSMTTANLATVRYATHDTLYACGEKGVVLRSTNGGADWILLKTGTSANLFRVRFENGSVGEVRGEQGIRLTTHDAGATWGITQ